jgi:hypothetical protein
VGREFAGYEPYQAVALELFERFGAIVHGLSWESFHRNQLGRVYAIFTSGVGDLRVLKALWGGRNMAAEASEDAAGTPKLSP